LQRVLKTNELVSPRSAPKIQTPAPIPHDIQAASQMKDHTTTKQFSKKDNAEPCGSTPEKRESASDQTKNVALNLYLDLRFP
jgi:hypothetical protein